MLYNAVHANLLFRLRQNAASS